MNSAALSSSSNEMAANWVGGAGVLSLTVPTLLIALGRTFGSQKSPSRPGDVDHRGPDDPIGGQIAERLGRP